MALWITRIATSRKLNFQSPKLNSDNTFQSKLTPKTWRRKKHFPLLRLKRNFCKPPSLLDFETWCDESTQYRSKNETDHLVRFGFEGYLRLIVAWTPPACLSQLIWLKGCNELFMVEKDREDIATIKYLNILIFCNTYNKFDPCLHNPPSIINRTTLVGVWRTKRSTHLLASNALAITICKMERVEGCRWQIWGMSGGMHNRNQAPCPPPV